MLLHCLYCTPHGLGLCVWGLGLGPPSPWPCAAHSVGHAPAQPRCSLAPGDDPAFLAQQSPASAQLTPELAAQLQALLKEGLEEDCPVW